MIILSVNLANAGRNEKSEEWRFGKRMNGLLESLKTVVDGCGCNTIVCLQEIRICKNEDGSKELSAKEIVEFFANGLNLSYVMLPNNMTDLSFYKATLYNPKRFLLTDCQNHWSGNSCGLPSGPQFCCSAMETRFIAAENYNSIKGCFVEGTIFALFNCHAPVEEADREIYTKSLIHIKDKHPRDLMIFIGNFNTIPDTGGEKQMKVMTQHFKHLTPSEEPSFYSYPDDLDPNGNQYVSRLDHAFANVDTPKFQVECKEERLIRWDKLGTNQWSDHLPLIVRLELHGTLALVK